MSRARYSHVTCQGQSELLPSSGDMSGPNGDMELPMETEEEEDGLGQEGEVTGGRGEEGEITWGKGEEGDAARVSRWQECEEKFEGGGRRGKSCEERSGKGSKVWVERSEG
ncbi:hypothetical protein NDU88_000223 [Pleurodeles waltl]|uniref:Uncharacterized protein n=1 Tax=Pleurodeles waltl TaxID=8319 RepID=A0AAV7Q2H1_PLEWA|nr:hypothetical protein NDU88_000223 [Pleurodeles waltl]